jgi:Mg-chelatase subunit ChlD
MSDARAEAVLGSILEADGGTNLVKAMKKAAESLEKRPERDRFLFLLTDGDIASETEAAVREAAQDLEQQGIHLLAIGIGIQPLHRIFPDSETIQNASQLPEVLGKSLTRVLQ